ncbi:radical SAM protein [Polaribacter sp. MSW13]|uniref:Radical SAM protein n=1 Tax=Polaribacter marinus TaxID=2916838 RepID=A0A9X1VQA4_9FLAO|nr:radical SAM protein [Polaribacter marinus]MCI2230331.1 radical SAM protein [Polaribacter marinus]
MKLDLIFAPQHDPGFPHSALPHLKGFLMRELPEIEVKCHDLNHLFYKSVIGSDYNLVLNDFRHNVDKSNSIEECISNVLDFEKFTQSKFDLWSLKHDGFRLTLRSLDAPHSRTKIEEIIKFSENVTPFDSLFGKYLQESDADVFGINLSVEDQILPSFRLVFLIRELKPKAKIIWGGALLSRVFPVFGNSLKHYFDFIIIREGEMPLASLLKYLLGKNKFPKNDDKIKAAEDIKNCSVVRDFEKDTTQVTDISITGGQIFEDYDVDNYWNLTKMLPLLSSRKCYWGKCKFCTIHESWDPKKRILDYKVVLREISNLVNEYSIRDFRFVDEASPPNLLKDLSKGILEARLDINFEIYGIAEKRFLNQSFVSQLGLSGCVQSYFGLESIDKDLIKQMGKKINQSDSISQIFKNCAESGIHVYSYALFGYPGATEKANKATTKFIINELNLHTATIGSFVPVIGSPFALENKNSLVHENGFTEDFSVFIDENQMSYSGRELGNKEAKKALREVLESRPDLALTTLFNDESRYYLSKKFGANFAQKVDVSKLNTLRGEHSIIDFAIRQRIDRGH